jgi:DNA-binding IclR family transcriptional regulator
MTDGQDWMSPIDRQILDFFEKHDIIINPASLAANIDYDRNYTARRCKVLVGNGLLEQIEGPKYRLSSKGNAYISGELDAGDLKDE